MIPGFNEERVADVLRNGLSPSAEIRRVENLVGRNAELQQIRRAFNSRGRIIFIYGDRGVGKSSLALSAASQFAKSTSRPIHVKCGSSTKFSDIVEEVIDQADNETSRFEKKKGLKGFKATLFGTGVGIELTEAERRRKFSDLNFAINAMRHVANERSERTVIVIDEFERLTCDKEKQSIAEFFKNFPDDVDYLKLMVCGIASSIEEMLGRHLSTGRRFENVRVESLHHDALWQIIQSVADQLNVNVGREALIRLSQISDGFPHYTHLIGETLFWQMHDDQQNVSTCNKQHFEGAIRNALKRSDEEHKRPYEKAILKSKLSKQYEIALWCLADHNDRRRQITSIFNQSYQRLRDDFISLGYPIMDKNALNQRLLNMRSENHARIVRGHGSGWFEFRENVMRGYVRMVAEDKGLTLAKDHFVT